MGEANWKPEENPAPKPGTRCRLVGPEQINGMNTWRVIRYDWENGKMKATQVGERCMTHKEALRRIDDVVNDKKVIYVGPHRFERKAL